MIPLEKTELKIVSCSFDNSQTHLFFLVDSLKSGTESITQFLKEAYDAESNTEYDFVKDKTFEQILEYYGIIDVFDEKEISQLNQEGLIDIKDLHRSIYQLLSLEYI